MSRVAAFALAAALCAQAADAQEYPNRPVRVVVPFVAGASYDTVARIVTQPLAEILRQQFVVDNRAGGSGVIGANLIAKAAPDGYTIGVIGNNQLITSAVNKALPYDLVADFTPVTRVARLDMVIAVNPALPARTLKELIALCKSQPGKFYYGSGGVAGAPHLATEQFKALAGIDIVHVPYKGGGLAVTGLVSNEVQIMVANMISIEPQAKSGRLRALAIAAKSRAALLPDVPTTAEAGMPGYESSQWYGIVAPARMPPAIVKTLLGAIERVLAQPATRQKLATQGAEPMTETPAEFAAYLKKDIADTARVAAAAGVKPE